MLKNNRFLFVPSTTDLLSPFGPKISATDLLSPCCQKIAVFCLSNLSAPYGQIPSTTDLLSPFGPEISATDLLSPCCQKNRLNFCYETWRDVIRIFGGTGYLINKNLKSIDKKDNVGNYFFSKHDVTWLGSLVGRAIWSIKILNLLTKKTMLVIIFLVNMTWRD